MNLSFILGSYHIAANKRPIYRSGHSGIYISQKIGTSKSKLIKVPKDATLLHYRQNKSKDKPM